MPTEREIDEEWAKALEEMGCVVHIFENRHRFANGRVDKKRLSVDDLMSKVIHAGKLDKRSSVEVTLSPQPAEIEGDELSLVNAITNIVLNGIHWAEEKQGRHAAKVKVEGSIEQNIFKMSISDNGPGMTEEVKAKIFELGFTKRENGTGVGLAETDYVIKQHNGTIEVESELGKGTTFIIKLPLIQDPVVSFQPKTDLLVEVQL